MTDAVTLLPNLSGISDTPDTGSNLGPLGVCDDERTWQQTNCYVDLWLSLLHAWRLEPRAALAFTVAQDFEGDHFTFCKFPPNDLAQLYGIAVYELALYDDVERHIETQIRLGHLVLIEIDAFHLPDTIATSYHREHTKTTIGIDRLDRNAHFARYFHNTGYHTLSGDDYVAALRTPFARGANGALYPYAEIVKRLHSPLPRKRLAQVSLELLRTHLQQRPVRNPVSAFRAAFAVQIDELLARGTSYFHPYSFNTLRQLGANFELLSHHLQWLEAADVLHTDLLRCAREACVKLASEAKVLQFRVARIIARRRPDYCDDCFDILEQAYQAAVPSLAAQLNEQLSTDSR